MDTCAGTGGGTGALAGPVKEAGADSFYMAAYDAAGIRYAMVKEGKAVERTCQPADEDACPGGEW